MLTRFSALPITWKPAPTHSAWQSVCRSRSTQFHTSGAGRCSDDEPDDRRYGVRDVTACMALAFKPATRAFMKRSNFLAQYVMPAKISLGCEGQVGRK